MKKKRTTRLRTRIIVLLALLVLLQSIALVLTLSFSGVFYMLDAEALRHFNNTTDERADSFDAKIGALVNEAVRSAESMDVLMKEIAEAHTGALQSAYKNDALYADMAMQGTEVLLQLLDKTHVTGAFFVLNGSNANQEDSSAHSAVYIRNTSSGTAGQNSTYQLELGPIAVSREYRLATSIKWNLDIRFTAEDQQRYAFYHSPIWASMQVKRAEMLRYGYWSVPEAILEDNKYVVCYTLPLRDENGDAYGVIGAEISLQYFTQYYLPNTNLPYQNSFYAVASMDGESVDLNWLIPSGPLAQVYLQQGTKLRVSPVEKAGMYETHLEGLGDTYCTMRRLHIYSENSPFYENSWELMGFVPKAVLHTTSNSVRNNLVGSIIVTTVVAFLSIFLMSYLATRKIAGLSEYVSGLTPSTEIHFQETGMREIDDLTSAVERLNRKVMSASKTTSKILSLTLLPIGGYELYAELNQVVLTEYVCELLHLEHGRILSREEWEDYLAQLRANPARGYESIYRYEDKKTGDTKWLRIVQAYADSGIVGVILDVTKDIEEHRRLAHELDYDALTRLYNRTAFKREAHRRIQDAPEKLGALIFSDLDNLKYINDTFGHDMGDRLIIKAGQMFQEYSQQGGIAARISGDEFAIYLHGFDSKDEIRALLAAQNQKNAGYVLETPDGSHHRIRYSSGVAWYPEDSDNVTDLLKLADYAMYEAKHNSKGTLYEFSRESYQMNSYLFDNREAINKLLDEGLIHFALQPIVDLRTGEVFAYEALMRSLMKEFNSPMEILKVAAAQSKLGQLESLVMLTAFKNIAKNLADLGDTKIFLNSIPSQTLSDTDYRLLDTKYAHVFKNVVIEITEAENNNPDQFASKMDYMRNAGMMIALDDFGSGYSNEMRILSMNPDIVKIDIGMIQNIHQDEDKQQLVANLLSFCKPKGIKMIGEGVEGPEDLEMLIRLGMDYVQGYYTGRPQFGFSKVDLQAKEQIRLLQSYFGSWKSEG